MLQATGKKRFPIGTRVEVSLKQHLQNDLADAAAARHQE
jgi:hypothetical protein